MNSVWLRSARIGHGETHETNMCISRFSFGFKFADIHRNKVIIEVLKSTVAYMLVSRRLELLLFLDIRNFDSSILSDKVDELIHQLLDQFVLSKTENATLGVFIEALKKAQLNDISYMLEAKIQEYENQILSGKSQINYIILIIIA